MARISCEVLLFLSVLWTSVKGDVEVSCVFMESCILPCSFQAGNDSIIQWTKGTVNTSVQSYHHNQNQLTNQSQHFRGRASLFKDQISSGNASLQLTGVQIQDQDSYRCFTSTNRGTKESFINLIVHAPVRKVVIGQVGNRITCSSEGIYPEPKITWSTSPPSKVSFKDTTVQQTEQQLYSITSSLILSDSVSDLVYNCTVNTGISRGATVFKAHVEVSCVFMESCFLPCSFQAGNDTVIRWTQETTGNTVHNFNRQNQLKQQNPRFRGRTSLSKDEISRGSALLQLTGVQIQDQGRYRCFTRTNRGMKESFFNLKVEAPVSEVDIKRVGNRITCSSEGIYPEPTLTWSTSSPSKVGFKDRPRVMQNERLLYSITSSLILSDINTDLVYNCTVSTGRTWGTNVFKAHASPVNPPSVLPRKKDVEVSCVFMGNCILPCSFQPGLRLVIQWTHVTTGNTAHYFNRQNQLIYRDPRFRGRTSLDQISRGSASLQLTRVQIQDQGRYRCYTSTIRGWKESFINVKVHAPVHNVNIQRVGNRITCRSEGIYPEPTLTWSTSPPSKVSFNYRPRVTQNERQLYSITSSLILSDIDPDLVCTVSTGITWRANHAYRAKPPSVLPRKKGIIGGVAGAVLAVVGAVASLVYYCRKNRGSQLNSEAPQQMELHQH